MLNGMEQQLPLQCNRRFSGNFVSKCTIFCLDQTQPARPSVRPFVRSTFRYAFGISLHVYQELGHSVCAHAHERIICYILNVVLAVLNMQFFFLSSFSFEVCDRSLFIYKVGNTLACTIRKKYRNVDFFSSIFLFFFFSEPINYNKIISISIL